MSQDLASWTTGDVLLLALFAIAIGVASFVAWLFVATALPAPDAASGVIVVSEAHPNPLFYALRGILAGRVGSFVDASRPPPTIPRILLLTSVSPDPARLRAYLRLCRFEEARAARLVALRSAEPFDLELPMTYPQVLAEVLGIAATAHPRFPLPVIPFPIHFRQQIELFRPLFASDRLSFMASVPPLRGTPRGYELDFVVNVLRGGDRVACTTLTALYRAKKSKKNEEGDAKDSASAKATEVDERLPRASVTASWALPTTLGREYAAASGDYNPIHLYGALGRLAGFPGAIIHGMWTLAASVAELERAGLKPVHSIHDATQAKSKSKTTGTKGKAGTGTTGKTKTKEERVGGDEEEEEDGDDRGFFVDVTFRKPLVLPATATFRAEPVSGGREDDAGRTVTARLAVLAHNDVVAVQGTFGRVRQPVRGE